MSRVHICLVAAIWCNPVTVAQSVTSHSLDATAALRTSLASAEKAILFTGLPRGSDGGQVEANLKPAGLRSIGGFKFHSHENRLFQGHQISALLSDATSIRVFGGEKYCGGFHPDCAVCWTGREGHQCLALVCLTCHELLFIDDTTRYRYDLTNKAFDRISVLLKAFGIDHLRR
jgi:hypothetical protein